MRPKPARNVPSGTAAAVLLATTLATALAACSAAPPSAGGAGSRDAAPMPVAASFYPLQFAAEQVGGHHVQVTGLTKAGVEPHDLELTPKDVAAVSSARVVVYAKGFQPAVDAAVAQQAGDARLDVASVARLDLPPPSADAGAVAPSGPDPHFWLDPQRYAQVATAIGARFATADPAHSADYATNTKAFVEALTTLDTQLRQGTASCQTKELVTSHAAFGYLSQRYGFTQVAIAGLSPDTEPSAAKLAEVADYVRAHGITTIYAETLVEPAFAETVAKSTGATVAMLDPVEGLTDRSAGKDYLEVMRANLTALRAGQRCQ